MSQIHPQDRYVCHNGSNNVQVLYVTISCRKTYIILNLALKFSEGWPTSRIFAREGTKIFNAVCNKKHVNINYSKAKHILKYFIIIIILKLITEHI